MSTEIQSPEFDSALVIGTGLIGTSIALRLSALGVEVGLQDAHHESAEIAEELGAGELDAPDRTYDLAVVAVPPQLVTEVVADVIDRNRAAHVTDVGSTKRLIASQAVARGISGGIFVPSHPMAGREIAGPRAAKADLFEGKAWAITPLPGTERESLKPVGSLVLACGALPVETTPEQHDRSVALVSHMNHIVSSLLGVSLHGQEEALPLAGTGIESTIRLAGGNPDLWTGILTTNGDMVLGHLRAYRERMDEMIDALQDAADDPTNTAALTELLQRGVDGKGLLDRTIAERTQILP